MSCDKNVPMVCPKYGLHSHMVSTEFREPFISKGYRCENMHVWDCIRTIFKFKCNETFNIWTHFIPFLVFSVKFVVLFSTEISITDPFFWPLAANAVGVLGFCIVSSCAHTFCALSLKARHTCFYADYAAISIYSTTAWQATYFYGRPIDTHVALFDRPRMTMFVCFLISIVCTVQSCSTRHMNSSLKPALRVSSFVFPWVFAAFPYIYRIVSCDSNNDLDCDYIAFTKFIMHGLLYLTGAVFAATKYPERLFPGKFDSFGQSHQIMHICTAIGADLQFDSIKLDALKREAGLRVQVINKEFSTDCFGFTVAAIIFNVLLAFTFNHFLERLAPTEKQSEKQD